MFRNELLDSELDIEVFELPPASFDELDLSDSARQAIEFDRPTPPSLPNGAEGFAPGVVMSASQAVADPSQLPGRELIRFLRIQQRLISHHQARYYAGVAALMDVMSAYDEDFESATHAAGMELRAALRMTRRMAEMELDFAQEIVGRLPRVAEELEAGSIDVRRARVLADGTAHLEQGNARRVVNQIIERAGQLTTGELRARLRKLCLEVDPSSAQEEYEHAHEQRKLVVDPTVSGTADLHITGARPDKAARAADRINHIARSLHTSGETRTMDQLRADIAIDLLCGSSTYDNVRSGSVTVHVDLDTLTRLTEMPGDLAGYGPVVADIARQAAEQTDSAEWRFRVTDPDSGQAVAAGVTRKRRHNTHQRRTVEIRDQVCAFPGCRHPSSGCDIDHTNTWAETGLTTIADSAPLDRYDHTGRHKFGWTYFRLPNGDYLWLSRLGLYYTKSGRPPPDPG